MRRYGASLDRAKMLLERAIEIEGESPPLRAMRAFLKFSKVRGGTATDLRPLDIAESEARALIELVPDAPYGHALLGFVGFERGDLKQAARYLTKAMERDPADPDVQLFLAITMQAAGQIEPVPRLAESFYAADPLSSFAAMLVSVAEWYAGRPGNRIEVIESGLAMDPQNPIIHWALGYTYALAGRMEDAATHVSWMPEHTPDISYTIQLASLVHAVQGHRDAALQALGRLGGAPLDAHQTFHLSESFAWVGATTRALELREWAVDHGYYPNRFIGEWCRFMQPLRGLPEFDRIVAKAARRVAEFSA